MATSGSKSVTVTSWDTLKFSWWENSQSVANNTTTIGWKMELIAGSSGRISSTASKDWSVTVNGKTYSGTNTIGISNNSTKTLASGTTTITHDSNGAKTFSYSFSQQFSITFSGSSIGTKSGSGEGTLDTIPRASSFSVSNGTLGTSLNLSVTKQDSSFTHTITYKCENASGTVCTKSSSTSVAWNTSNGNTLNLAEQNKSGTKVSVTFTLTTYSGNTAIGSSVTKTITMTIPTSVKPSCSVNIEDATNITTLYGSPVKGLSKFKVTVTATTAQGSAISSYKTSANGATYTSSSFTTDVLKSSGTVKVTATVTDKRGRSGTGTASKTVLDYSPPVISKLTVGRCDEDGSANDAGPRAKVSFQASFTSLSGKNSVSYVLKYRKSSSDIYTEITPTAEELTAGACYFDADTGSSYVVEFSATDNHNTTTRTTTVSTGFVLMHWSVGGDGMGIGKVAELPDVLDIGMTTRHYGGILHPLLAPNTDLNTVLTPNTYVGANLTDYNYTCGDGDLPLTSGTFSLEVIGMGDQGQVKQRLTYCQKTLSRAWERIYHSTEGKMSWGDWICVSDFDGQLLWDGAHYMTETQTATLSEPISKQRSGIVLIFSRYSGGEAQDYHFNSHFIPKYQVSLHPGAGCVFVMSTKEPFSTVGSKYLYINDQSIVGSDVNEAVGTASGVTYDNKGFVLRHVIGV